MSKWTTRHMKVVPCLLWLPCLSTLCILEEMSSGADAMTPGESFAASSAMWLRWNLLRFPQCLDFHFLRIWNKMSFSKTKKQCPGEIEFGLLDSGFRVLTGKPQIPKRTHHLQMVTRRIWPLSFDVAGIASATETSHYAPPLIGGKLRLYSPADQHRGKPIGRYQQK